MITKMEVQVTDREIRQAVFHMNPWKAPSLDGFSGGFSIKICGT